MCFLVSEVCPKILFDAYILLASFLFGRVRNTLFRKKSFCYDTMIISAVSFRVLGDAWSLFLCLCVGKEECDCCWAVVGMLHRKTVAMWIAMELGESQFHG